jgi:hypothetical protein
MVDEWAADASSMSYLLLLVNFHLLPLLTCHPSRRYACGERCSVMISSHPESTVRERDCLGDVGPPDLGHLPERNAGRDAPTRIFVVEASTAPPVRLVANLRCLYITTTADRRAIVGIGRSPSSVPLRSSPR